MIRVALAPLLCGLLLVGPAAAAQEHPPARTGTATLPAADAGVAPAADAADVPDSTVVAGGFRRFFGDVARDYRDWFTLDSARTVMVGTAVTMSVRPFDEALTERGFPEAGNSLTLGDDYGNLLVQVPLAVSWWGVGHAIGPRHGDAGRDLLRAQINAATWTYAVKFAVNRTRPNGDSRSFPSGHSSATFATATVLHRHYGWRVALPFYGLGVYTAAARINDRKHWLSDTVMGATVGITAGRAVTFHLKRHPVRVVPAKVAGGVMIQFVVDPEA
jgi:hypothetical protein